jgi:aminopeptidase N
MAVRLLLSVFLLWPLLAAGQTDRPAAGVPLTVAEFRAAHVRDVAYDLALTVPRAATEPVRGTTRIRFTLRHTGVPLVLDFDTTPDAVQALMVNDVTATPQVVNGHLIVPAAALRDGINDVVVSFRAGDVPLNRNADFLYALFVPARARQAVPVFDQPDLKARWSLTLTYPAEWQAVSNGAALPEAPSTNGPSGTRTTRFAETAPLSTYLFSFVVGDFRMEEAERAGRTFRMFHRETDAAKVARNRDAIFDLHARALAFMEDYTALPYAFGKFDFVLIPAFQFGGMEHAGKILYNASGLMLDESATQNQQLGRASVIAHETAHMWFGDLVTMRWFNDVWMKEVFANFMAAKIVNPSFPEVNHPLRFLLAHYPAAYEVDRTAGANPIRQPLDNLQEAGSLYGAIIYQKAPVMMRHLEALLGEASFRDGLREYLAAHRFGNATWTDLIEVLDRRTPADLQAWSRVWVEAPGRPTLTTTLDVRDGRISRLRFSQSDPRQRGLVWPQQLRVALGLPDGVRMLPVMMDGASVDVPDAVGLPAPRWVLPSADGWAYGDIVLDAESRGALLRDLPTLGDPLLRGSAWVTLWDGLLEQRIRADEFLTASLAALPRETDEQLTARILGYTQAAWWRFLEPSARMAQAPALEALLREGLTRASTAGQKASWFGALRQVALTAPTVDWLRQVWSRQVRIEGLPLSENDETALALELAVREIDGWQAVLDTQLARIDNPDRKGRFAFVMPALSADPVVRERWFRALADAGNRRREPWVLEGLSYLHHPLRARASAGFIAPSLELLWDIQRTGDIFFPKRWLDSTLGGHRSPEVAAMVRQFLDSRPAGYPERLRQMTLQSADELFRAAAPTGRR